MEPTVFKIFTKVSLSNVVWKLKIGKKSFLSLVPKLSNITQTLQLKTPLSNALFFLPTIFSVYTLKTVV